MHTPHHSSHFSTLRGLARSLILDALYPPLCASCKCYLEPLPGSRKGNDSCHLCLACSLKLAEEEMLGRTLNLSHELCSFCASTLHHFEKSSGRCIACSAFPLACDSLHTLYYHRNLAKELVKRFKYQKQRAAGDLLAKLLTLGASNIMGSISTTGPWDFVIPIPSSTEMLRSRGFNHTGFLARRVAAGLGLSSLSLALLSRGKRAIQVNLHSPKERRENMKKAFVLSKSGIVREMLKEANILIIDDVCTTGATIDEAARTLKNAGATRVDALTVSRSPRFRDNRLKALLASPAKTNCQVTPSCS